MAAVRSSASTGRQRRLSSVDQLMLWGLFLSALFEVIRRLFAGHFGVSDVIFPGILLICAALIWTGWRWIFLAPIAFVVVAVLGGLIFDGLSPLIKLATH